MFHLSINCIQNGAGVQFLHMYVCSVEWRGFFLQIEAELEASRSHIREESDRICRETAKLRQEQLRLKTESETTAKEKERLEALEKDVEQRSQEAKNLCQVHPLMISIVRNPGIVSWSRSMR